MLLLEAVFGAAFNVSYTQFVTLDVGTESYAVRTHSLNTSSSASGHGSISNGSDISKSR